MKRQADIQLVKGGAEDSSDDEGTPEQGMKKASEAELDRRIIRPLPSRNKSSSTPAATFPAPTPTTSGPSLFSSPNPFSPNPTTIGTASTSSFAGFGPKANGSTAIGNAFSSTLSPSSFKVSQPAPSTPSAATSTFKTFSSVLNNSGPNPFGAPAPTAPTAPSPGRVQGDTESMKYYKNLRGLNLCFISAITKSIEGDPYIDLTEALEKYKSYRSEIQADFGDSSKANDTSALPTTLTPTLQPSSSSSTPATMPAPPPSFPEFGGFKLPASSTTPANGSTTFSSASNTTGFKPTNVTFGSSTISSPFSFPSESKIPSSLFGASTSAPSLSSAAASSSIPTSAPFTFGGSASSSAASASPFGSFGTSLSQPSTSPSNPFGVTSSQTSSTFAFGKPIEKPVEGFATTSSAHPFGSTENSASSSFFSTSKPPTSGLTPFSFAGSSAPSVFGGKSETPVAVSAEENTVEGESSERGTPATEEGTPGLLSSNPLEEGAGEENEETVHAVKAKAFKLIKDSEGAGKWAPQGIGMLRIKKDKDSGSRRILLRNNTNGKVVLNFKIYSAMKPAQNKVSLSFIGHDDGAPQTYSIRMGKEDEATLLKEVLQREIAFVKEKET
ncbi:hypothetical protein BDN70DRAFT_879519 [Pholiota conissans]|uniref:RanBD1 domain-containing protein n=1 Tax=Pholiota conissans TaxID=109636 RepID=A0A9P5Z2B0_9AGAR|nr:hypothetical protein BDN70DRAFT_879519 [Pholiota conissans]